MCEDLQDLLPDTLDAEQLQLLMKQNLKNSEESASSRRLRNALISEADDLQPYQLQTEDQHSSGNKTPTVCCMMLPLL